MIWFLIAQVVTLFGILKIAYFREKLIKRFPWVEKKKDHITAICILLGVSLSTFKYFSNTGDLSSEITELKNQNQSLSNNLNDANISIKSNEDKLEAVRRFSYIASTDFQGKSGDMEIAPIRALMDGTWKPSMNAGSFRPVCTEKSYVNWKITMEKFPDFPYSYFAMARCLLEAKDPAWRTYANPALKVLKGTTQIPNHNPDQDNMIKYLETNLQGNT